MNENDRELLDGLRALGSDGPREAPGRLEEHLKAQFRKQSRRRTFVAWARGFGVAAAVLMALILWTWSDAPRSAQPAVAETRSVVPAVEEEADAGFYLLPEAEALPAVENAMVVRVQLPVSSLRLMGFPVGEEGAGASVQAELLLGQDGLARGVRLAE